MDKGEERFWRAIERTQVVRFPKQQLATFGVTTLRYYVVTEPAYADLVSREREAVVRDGKVVAERPAVVTPSYMLHLEGFSPAARRYFEHMVQQHGPHSAGLLYAYRNEPQGLNIVTGEVAEVAGRIKDDLDRKDDPLSAVMLGVDELWDVSLLKFIHELTASSLARNVQELSWRGLLESSPGLGIPRAAVERIEELFQQVAQGADPALLKRELDRWDVWEQYQDRFLALFRQRPR